MQETKQVYHRAVWMKLRYAGHAAASRNQLSVADGPARRAHSRVVLHTEVDARCDKLAKVVD